MEINQFENCFRPVNHIEWKIQCSRTTAGMKSIQISLVHIAHCFAWLKTTKNQIWYHEMKWNRVTFIWLFISINPIQIWGAYRVYTNYYLFGSIHFIPWLWCFCRWTKSNWLLTTCSRSHKEICFFMILLQEQKNCSPFTISDECAIFLLYLNFTFYVSRCSVEWSVKVKGKRFYAVY